MELNNALVNLPSYVNGRRVSPSKKKWLGTRVKQMRVRYQELTGTSIAENGLTRPPDSGDAAERSFGSDTAEVQEYNRNNQVEEAGDILFVLQQLSRGRYGKCLGCDLAIPVTRLNARPHAVFCKDCQTKVDEDKTGMKRQEFQQASWERADAQEASERDTLEEVADPRSLIVED